MGWKFPRMVVVSCTALALVGCQRDGATAPRVLASASAAMGAPLACDVTALRQAASDFFVSPTDPIYQVIRDIELTWQPGGTPAADTKSFDGMQRIAQARG